jgi:asparagine synthase (glutamine-hydrolysing)
LIRATPVDREVDEDYVAGYLGYGVDLDRTIYRHIASVAPAQAVTFDKTGRRATRTTWSLAKDPAPIAYRDDREYEGRFLALFKEGVKARLRTPHPVVSELSGGLDSSSVVCMADRLLRDGEGHAPSFSTISMVSPSAASKDEKFREAVEAQCGRPAYHVKQEATTFVDLPHLSHLHILSSRLVLGSWELAVSGRMRDVGAHTLLTGVGGDEMCYSPHEPSPGLADLLVQGRFSAFHVLASNWSHLLRRPYVSVLRDAIEAAYRCRVSRTPWKQWKPAPWIHPRLRERAIAIREARFRRLRGYRLPRVQMSAFSYEHDLFSISHGDRQEFDARYVTYPFLHRPFVEFMHAVPFEQKLRMAESRSLLRRAMRGVVPETLLTRRGKGQYTTAVIRSFLDGQLDIDHFLVDSMAHARGYVDAAAVRRLVDRARMGQETSLPYTALALETWLRQHASDRPSASVRAVPRAQSLDPART